MEPGGGRPPHPGYFLGEGAQKAVSFHDAASFDAGGLLQRVRRGACQRVRLFARCACAGDADRRHCRHLLSHRDGGVRAGGALLLLFGAVLFFLLRGQQQRQPRQMQTALPQIVFHRQSGLRRARLCALFVRSQRRRARQRAPSSGRHLVENRGQDAAGGVRLGGGRLLPRHFGRGGEKRAFSGALCACPYLRPRRLHRGPCVRAGKLALPQCAGAYRREGGRPRSEGRQILLPRERPQGGRLQNFARREGSGRRRVRHGGRAGVLPLFREQAARGRRGAHHDGHRAQRGASQKGAAAGSQAFPALCGGGAAQNALRRIRNDGRTACPCGARAPFRGRAQSLLPKDGHAALFCDL